MERINKERIIKDLRNLGLREGDIVMVHSSLSSLGYVEGGADTVIDALLEVVGKEGTIAVPNLPVIWYSGETHMNYLKKQPIFDVRVTPSKVGVITEVLRKRENSKRSLHPSHSVAAIGAKRDWLIEDHERCSGPCGKGTPYWKICQEKGKILLLGVSHASNTTIHTIEEEGGAPTLTEETFYPLVIDYEGRIFTVPMHAHVPRHRYLQKMESVCKESRIVKMGKVGEATARLVQADKLLEIGIEILRKDKEFFFREE